MQRAARRRNASQRWRQQLTMRYIIAMHGVIHYGECVCKIPDTGMLTLEGKASGSQPLQNRHQWLPWVYVRSHTPPFHHTRGFLGLAGRAERGSCVWWYEEIRSIIIFQSDITRYSIESTKNGEHSRSSIEGIRSLMLHKWLGSWTSQSLRCDVQIFSWQLQIRNK